MQVDVALRVVRLGYVGGGAGPCGTAGRSLTASAAARAMQQGYHEELRPQVCARRGLGGLGGPWPVVVANSKFADSTSELVDMRARRTAGVCVGPRRSVAGTLGKSNQVARQSGSWGRRPGAVSSRHTAFPRRQPRLDGARAGSPNGLLLRGAKWYAKRRGGPVGRPPPRTAGRGVARSERYTCCPAVSLSPAPGELRRDVGPQEARARLH